MNNRLYTREWFSHFAWVYDLMFGHGRYVRINYAVRLLLGIGYTFTIFGTLMSCLWIFLLMPLPFGVIFFGLAFIIAAYAWCVAERVVRAWRLATDNEDPIED